MPAPTLIETTPTDKFANPRQLFKSRTTGEYCICVGRPGKKNARWVSLQTTDKLEAIRRLERTGVGSVLSAAADERFTDRVVDILQQRDKVPLERVAAEYLADLLPKVGRQSMAHPRTITSQFMAIMPMNVGIADITPQQVNEWINTAPAMTRRRRRMSVLGAMFKFAFDQGYRKDNVAARLGMQTHDLSFEDMEREIKEPFTQAEFDQLMACDKIQGFWRWSIQLSWWLGLRMSDCCKLQWGSFCASPGKLVVWQAKTRRRVELDLSDPILGGGAISAVVAEMRMDVKDAEYCFPEWREQYDRRQSAMVDLFREQAYLAGLDGLKTFHCFRKSAAMRWEKAGRSLDEIGAMLGHEGTGNARFYLETR